MTRPAFARRNVSMSKRTKKNDVPRLIVAASENDPDMLYATRFFAPDAFIFLEERGKRTLVLSDLEIDRARKTAQADEFVSYSALEREVQGNQRMAPAYEKVLAHFLRKRGVRAAVVPANFPLGFAQELAASNIQLGTTNGLFWPEREAKTDEELKLMRRALRITEAGMARAMEVLKASKPGAAKKLNWSGKTLTSEVLRAEIDSAILRAGGLPANTIVAAGREERLFRRHDANGRSWPRERRTTALVGNGARRPGIGVAKNEARGRRPRVAQRSETVFYRSRISDGSSRRQTGRLFSRHRSWSRVGDPRVPAIPENGLQSGTSPHGRARPVLSGFGRRSNRGRGGGNEIRAPAALPLRETIRTLAVAAALCRRASRKSRNGDRAPLLQRLRCARMNNSRSGRSNLTTM
jgi:hypothetical protein